MVRDFMHLTHAPESQARQVLQFSDWNLLVLAVYQLALTLDGHQRLSKSRCHNRQG